ncbi:thermonuclease family protein [uncultured Paraglaciecola sp.]|uniref:thermonuclease family protein n=1 Tax=uncultured Paraglaciecola sp. TaxID=1765024 RepID=UPI00262A0F06|nr:thermonuclease family protein [uncultured Paraglaciecola sp.]
MIKDTYLYDAKFSNEPRSIYDGDTVKLDVDLGMLVWAHQEKMRLYGIDTPELYGEERAAGIIVRDYVRRELLGKRCVVQTFKTNSLIERKGKYGRWLAVIWLRDRNFNKHLIEKGYAKQNFYGDPIPEHW